LVEWNRKVSALPAAASARQSAHEMKEAALGRVACRHEAGSPAAAKPRRKERAAKQQATQGGTSGQGGCRLVEQSRPTGAGRACEQGKGRPEQARAAERAGKKGPLSRPKADRASSKACPSVFAEPAGVSSTPQQKSR